MNIHDFDIRSYLDALRIPYWEAGVNVGRGWLGIQCIYCQDHHNHLGISLFHKNASCWLCHTTASITDLICDLENTNYRAALDRIDEFQSFKHLEIEVRDRLANDGKSVLPEGCVPLRESHRVYLEGRGFDPDQLVQDWGLVSAPVVGKWKHRIIIPVIIEGRVLTFVGLDHTGANPTKYKAAAVEESFAPTSELVYGANHAGGNVVLVEGTTDAWRIGKGAVATFGMNPGNRRILHLSRMKVDRFFVMYDGEKDAIKNAYVVASMLLEFSNNVEVLEMEMGFDPDDMSAQEVEKLRHNLEL